MYGTLDYKLFNDESVSKIFSYLEDINQKQKQSLSKILG